MAVIEVENLIKNYDGTNVVDGVSFSVPKSALSADNAAVDEFVVVA